MENYKTISGHTIDVSLLERGNVIDLGCRDFKFAIALRKLGCNIYAFDADKGAFEYYKKHSRIHPINKAVTTYNGVVKYAQLGECGYTNDVKEFNPDEQVDVECVDYNELATKEYDLLKIDIEGGEYSILSDERFKPFPKQISVEFHWHVFPELHDEMYPKVFNNLNKWYDLVYVNPDAPMMDCLFIRR